MSRFIAILFSLLTYCSHSKEINIAKHRKLIIEKNGRIKPTVLGQNFLNELLQIFLKD